MAWETGTAANHNDLLTKLRTFAVANGWTSLQWEAPSGLGPAKLKLRGPGAGPTRQVFINIQTMADTIAPYYSWKMSGAIGYSPAAAEGLQLGELEAPCYLNLWENPITYWFFVNDRRIIVVAKCSTSYMTAYLGFFLPFGLPPQYPFPLMVAGDYLLPVYWSNANAGRRSMCDPGADSQVSAGAYLRMPNGKWAIFNNHDTGSEVNNMASPGFYADSCYVWPWATNESQLGTSYDGFPGLSAGGTSGGGGLDNLQATRQNERPIWPAMLIPYYGPPFGVMDGVHCIPGQGLAAEQQVTVSLPDPRTFLVFQNINRTSGDDYFLIERV